MSTRLPPALWLLSAGAFAVGTDAYVIAGVLPQLARDLHVPISAAGQLVTVFAVAYAVLAPLSASASRRWSGKKLLMAALGVFCAGSLITATAQSFVAVLVGRVISALGAATFTPQASSAASALVPAPLRGRALATVIGGLTAATVFGVPLGTLLAAVLGWRATLGSICLLGLAALASVAAWLPPLPPSRSAPRAYGLGLRDRAVVVVLVVSLLTATAEQLVYTYVGPVLSPVTAAHPGALPALLLVFGGGAVVGNAIAGAATERYGSRTTLLLAVGGMTADLALLPWWSHAAPTAVAAMFLWGLTGWMYVVPQQHRLLTQPGTDGPLAVAVNNSVFYLGIAAGSAIGGGILYFGPPSWLAMPATGLGAAAAITTQLGYRS